MMPMDAQPLVTIRNLSKAFSGKTVVHDVSASFYPGRIVALVGENGAGKSTLKNMLCGLLEPTTGEILLEDRLLGKFHAEEYGIAAVHQEFSLFGSLTVAQNICISNLPGKALRVDWKNARRIAKEQLDFLGISIDPDTPVDSLGAGEQQVVEIAKAVLRASKLLILDEPTTSLTLPERRKLFDIMRKLKQQGLSIIFITHFMDEIFEVSDDYLTLRDGRLVGQGALKDVTRRELEEMMVGRAIVDTDLDLGEAQQRKVLEVKDLCSHYFQNISFSLHQGEILGIAGLMGAGRTEIAEAIFGITPSSGEIFIDGELASPTSVKKMKRLGVSFVTEDRRKSGLFGNRSVRENLSAANLAKFTSRSIRHIGFKDETRKAKAVSKQMNVNSPSLESEVERLSGGNQQKVLLGRWLATNPNICIFDEPTRGVDIGAKFEIHRAIIQLAKEGVSVLLVSSDLTELLQLSHRILVLRTGHIVNEVERDSFDPVEIISSAASSAFH